MKWLKYFFVAIILVAVSIAVWLYYPQYEIYKAKKEKTVAVTNVQADKQDQSKPVNTYLTELAKSKKEKLVHVGLGDSVMKGYGADVGESYVDVFSKELSSKIDKEVVPVNRGINGHTSVQLREEVLAHQYDEDLKNADIISLNIGGNDILKIVKSKGYSEAFKEFSELRSSYKNNMKDILDYIHEQNPQATVVVFELYNPVKTTESYYSLAEKLLPKWNVILYEVANHDELIAETTKTINDHHLEYLSPDGVRPNEEGYKHVAEEVLNQIEHTVK
ncbi:GDSL-type esterase/lipase family protein [Priestia filamentosa]|uniref:SGNH/GDSL hydrolase family protein n=1 Tax=Priestia filamentosa TaxID=1402861 RepID=UPI00397B07D3